MSETGVTLTGDCLDADGTPCTHSLSLDRHGHVTALDHQVSHDFEAVAEQLGGPYDSFCGRFQWAAEAVLRPGTATPVSFPARHVLSWRLGQPEGILWTNIASATVNTALFGVTCVAPISPPLAIAATQELVKRNMLPDNPTSWQDTLVVLSHPDARDNGWRQSSPATVNDVTMLLDAGAAPELLGDYYALGAPPDLVHQVATAFPPLRLPQLAFVHYLATHSIDDARELLTEFTPAKTAELLTIR